MNNKERYEKKFDELLHGITNPDAGKNKDESKRPSCRFYVFVMWAKGQRKYGESKGSYRGDEYVKDGDEGKMLRRLLDYFINKNEKFIRQPLFVLYDTSFPKSHPDRHIIRIKNGVIEQNRIAEYMDVLDGFYIPGWLSKER